MGKIDGKYFISNKKKPCVVCERNTNRIDIRSEKRICSIKCEKEYYNNQEIIKVVYLRVSSFTEENPLNGVEILDKIYIINDDIYKVLMKVREENVLEAMITFFNNFNDMDFINCKSFDNIIEKGEIICFEKNKKPIKNKSEIYNCYMNLELEYKNIGHMKIQILKCTQGDIDNHQQLYLISDSFN